MAGLTKELSWDDYNENFNLINNLTSKLKCAV